MKTRFFRPRVMIRGAAVAALAALALAGPAAAQEIKKGGTATIAIEGDLTGFEPLKSVFGQPGTTVASTMLETLVHWNFEAGRPEPLLATDWSESDDHLVWTLNLRQGVKFHDGTDFNADAVVFHFERLLDPANKYGGRGKLETITEVKKIDDYTVEFHLAHPWPALMSILADSATNGPIPSPKAVKEDTHNRHPVGTGPFVFSSWQSGDRIVVERNPDYWNADEINLDKIVFRILPDTQTRYASVQSGEVDAIWTDRGATIVDAQSNPDVISLYADGAGASTILLNRRKPPLDDPNVRAAIAHAWNQAALVKITFMDTRPVITHPLGNLKDCGPAGYREYNVEKAKEYAAKYGKPIEFEMLVTQTPTGRELGNLMQQLMKQVGITVNLRPVDMTTLIRSVFKREYDVSGWRMGDDSDLGPVIFSAVTSDSNYNLSGYNEPELDELARKMRVAPTREARLELQCEISQKINESVGQLYMGGGRYWAFTNKRIHGLGKPYGGVIDASRAWVED